MPSRPRDESFPCSLLRDIATRAEPAQLAQIVASCTAAICSQLLQYGPRNLPLGLADLGCARQLPIAMPRTGPLGSMHCHQSVLAPCRSPTTSCMRSPHPVPVAQLPLQRQRKPPTTSLLKAATSPLIGIPQSQRTHTSTTSQGTVSEAGSGTPPALVTSATHFATLPACCFTVRPTHEAVTIPSAEFRFYSSPPFALSAAARATNLGLPWSA